MKCLKLLECFKYFKVGGSQLLELFRNQEESWTNTVRSILRDPADAACHQWYLAWPLDDSCPASWNSLEFLGIPWNSSEFLGFAHGVNAGGIAEDRYEAARKNVNSYDKATISRGNNDNRQPKRVARIGVLDH